MAESEEFDSLYEMKGTFSKKRRRSTKDSLGKGQKDSAGADADSSANMISKRTRRDVINGLFHKLDAAFPRLPTDQVRQVRLYVTSAGKDTEVERTALVDKAVPELRKFCKERGLDFQLVDLRWGVPEESLSTILTADVCQEELARCQRLSVGPCYFLFLSDRLSDRSIPERIPLPVFDHVCAALFQRKLDPNRLIRWYKLDKNILPPDYVLKREELQTSPANTNGEATSEVLDLLEKGLATVYKRNTTGDLKLKLLGSGLEWVNYGELLNEHAEKQRAVCVIRTFSQINLADEAAKTHVDLRQNKDKMAVEPELQSILKSMKEDIISEDGDIMMDSAFHTNLPWSIKGIDPENNTHTQYLQSMVANVVQQTRFCIQRALKRHMTHSPPSDWLLEEVLNHVTYARQVHHCLRVRNDIIGQVLMYINDSECKNGKPFVVCGEAGSGKSLILGKVATSAASSGDDNSYTVAVRFAGTTARSQTLLDVLRSLILQVAEAFGVHHTIGSHSYGTSAMAYCFRKLLERVVQDNKTSQNQRTLVIIIDAIDLLVPESEDDADAMVDLSWLPYPLPPSIKVVLSARWSRATLEDRLGAQFYNARFVTAVDRLGEKVAEDTFDSWGQVEGRQLTRAQKEAVRGVFRSGSHPLLLRLVFSETCLWDSFSVTTGPDNNNSNITKANMAFEGGIEAACEAFFSALEKHHGKQLVNKTIGYLLAARDGLTECEIIDVLSQDDEVMSDIYTSWKPPSEGVVRLPHALWGRLRLRLYEHLVTCLSGGSLVLKLRRSILFDVARRRYLSAEARPSLHSSLADYFLAVHHDKVKHLQIGPVGSRRTISADRKQPPQPLRFGSPMGQVNFRKLTELPYQLYHAGRYQDLVTHCLGSYEWVSTVASTCGIEDVLRDVSMATTTSRSLWEPVMSSVILVTSSTSFGSLGISDKLRHQLELVKETLELVQVSAESGRSDNPLAVDIIGRLVALADRYPEVIGKLVHGAQQYCANPRRSLLVPLRPCFPSPSGAAVDRLVGHKGGATHLDLSPDGSTLVSGGTDGVVKVWSSGRVTRTLNHTEEVDHVCLLQERNCVVTLAGNKLHFMDLSTGELLRVLKVPEPRESSNHCEQDTAAAKNMDLLCGKRNVMTHKSDWAVLRSGCTAFVFDLCRMELLHQLDGHDDVITCLAMSEDGHHIVTGSLDMTLRVWHTDLGQELYVIAKHRSPITDASVAQTSQHLVSVSLDGSIVVAHLLTGNVLQQITWPGHALFSVAISASGARIAVGSFGEIGLWDAARACLVAAVSAHRQNISHVAYVAAANYARQPKKHFEYLMSMSTNGELKIWNIEDDNLTHSASGMVGKDATVKVAGNKAVMGSRDSPFLKVWSLNFDPESTTAPLEGGIYDPIAVSADGRYVVTVHSNFTDLVLYDVSRAVELHKLPAHKSKITCLCMLNDNQHVLSGAADGSVKMWFRNGETLEEVQSMAFDKEIVCLAPHPKNKMAVICHKNNVVRMRHMNNKDVDEALIQVQDSNITVVAVGDDQIIYGTDQGKVYVWSYENLNNPVMMLQGHKGAIRHLTIREKYLATIGDKEQSAIIWNCHTGKRLGDLPTGEDTVTSIAWTSDMHHIIIGFDTSLVHIYDVIAQTKLTSLDVYSPVSVIVAQSDIISISTTGGYFGVYKLVVSENFDPSIYSDSLETRYSVSSLQASRPTLQRHHTDRRKSSTCVVV